MASDSGMEDGLDGRGDGAPCKHKLHGKRGERCVQCGAYDPFHRGRVLEKHYMRTMDDRPYSEDHSLTANERRIMVESYTSAVFSAVTFVGPKYRMLIQEIDTAIASLIARGLVREVEITLP